MSSFSQKSNLLERKKLKRQFQRDTQNGHHYQPDKTALKIYLFAV